MDILSRRVCMEVILFLIVKLYLIKTLYTTPISGWSILRQHANYDFDLIHCHAENGKNLLYSVDAVADVAYNRNNSNQLNVFKIASTTFNDKTVRMERVIFPSS